MDVKIRWIAMAAVAVLALPGTAWAHGTSGQSSAKNASKLCKALRAEMGTELFRTTYGTNHNGRNAHGKCVSKNRHAVKQLIAEAVAQCKAELGATQSSKGDDKPTGAERKALRACVKAKLRALLAERREAFESAATTCKTERQANPAAFREKYGTNENKRNAFGKCVSAAVKAQAPAPQPAA
jgi:hypothetical protein